MAFCFPQVIFVYLCLSETFECENMQQQKNRRRRNQEAGVHRENPKRQLNVSVFIICVLLIAYEVYENQIKSLTQHPSIFLFLTRQ